MARTSSPRKSEVEKSSLASIRKRAENDLYYFAKLVNPQYQYGDIHKKAFARLQKDSDFNVLLLLPRAHLKSHCIAVWTVWQITKNPATSIVYLTAGEDLGKAQMYAIKGMLTSSDYMTVWPEMVSKEEAKRDTWSAWAINVDHPLRKMMGTRDNTVIVKTVKSNFTGLHCDLMVYDDIVVPGNAYSPTGRTEVKRAISQASSVLNPGGKIRAVGTRYHPNDIYNDFKNELVPVYDDEGSIVGEYPAWELMEEPTEDKGDGTGNFLWPRIKGPNGHWYGFDVKELAKIKARYFSLGERAQYFAQYYNEPNDPESNRLGHDSFQYYEPRHLQMIDGDWYFKDERLNLYAAADFAFTDSTRSDYTAIVVIGRNSKGMIYVLDMEQFRTSRFETYYTKIIELHKKWEFRKMKVESNAGANVISNYIKDRVREEGFALALEAKASSSKQGSKEQRIAAILEPRYENGDIFHYKAGLVHELEEQLIQERPAHDDLKDALAAAVEISVSPHRRANKSKVTPIKAHPRFGGLLRG